jgi:SAM-dependent methyltransferase
MMTRAEIETTIEPIIEKCRLRFAPGSSDTNDSPPTEETLRPEIRRVSLVASLAQAALGNDATGEGLEVGSGYGYLILPMTVLFPNIRWSAVDHPGQPFAIRATYRSTLLEHNCQFTIMDLVRETLPFPDGYFSLVTFSEVMEHLPPDRVNFVLQEIARTIRPGGILIASSPNQASLENRLLLLSGRSIFEMPDGNGRAKGVFGHIRLYTPAEVQESLAKLGFAWSAASSSLTIQVTGERANARGVDASTACMKRSNREWECFGAWEIPGIWLFGRTTAKSDCEIVLARTDKR